ncbi:ribonuclease III [Novosphingobium piscinae]|uniref:Ribonuclease 3 n=1 Tax=Novosphingobium piscinae TaxID=1507448 RepID=A0A7X1KQW3_9SPHN|nr:ribonuclease III [Novosphingobium piscinae]MBC2670154.1 ribonuclease III [Novosphingobium piscinae]
MPLQIGLSEDSRAFLEQLLGEPLADPALWCEALTHGSTGEPRNYERLEFLGDRVLGLVIAEWLHERGTGNEGKLSQRLNALVSRDMNAAIARTIGLGRHIRLGKQARDDGGADSDNILGDVLEALLGASFVSRGFAATRALVRQLWADPVEGRVGQSKHPKSALQEWAAGNRRRMPHYKLIARTGPDHAAHFRVAVEVHGVGEVEAEGSSKQEAETAAAAAFLQQFG